MSHHHGFFRDLEVLNRAAMDRRNTLRWLAAGGAASLPLIGCGGGGSSADASATSGTSATGVATGTTTTATTTTSTGTTTAATTTTAGTPSSSTCSTIPSETAGPYPGDGSNSNGSGTVNALSLSGIVRSNIVASIAGASGVAAGVPLTIQLKIVNSGSGMACASLAGFAVYVWHCDALGRYSLYSSGVTGENYLRGVQVTDSSGSVSFTSIFPGCYSGRWPHIHFEIYSSITAATRGANAIKTTQLALPEDACRAVYAGSGYSGSTANLNGVTLANDNVFSDGSTLQQATATGSVSAGYTSALQVGVAV